MFKYNVSPWIICLLWSMFNFTKSWKKFYEIKISRRSFSIYYRGKFRTTWNIYDRAFSKMVDDWKLLTIFAKCSIVDVWNGSEYGSVVQY